MKVNGLGLASAEMSHIKNLVYFSQSWEEENLDSASVHMFFGRLMVVVHGVGKTRLGQPHSSDSQRKVLAF